MSYVTLPSETVIALAERMIEAIDADRAAEVKKFIAAEIARSERSWWRKMWRRPVVTPEDVLNPAYFDTGDALTYWDPIYHIRCRYEIQYKLCKSLLRAARLSPEVNITAQDLSEITL